MADHTELLEMHQRSLSFMEAIRRETFTPEDHKTLRRFTAWEVTNFILRMDGAAFRKNLQRNPDLPQGERQGSGMRTFSLNEINVLRDQMTTHTDLKPYRPNDRRAMRVAISNFKGGVGKTVVAQHMAHAAALDGYKVLCVDFDPQASLTHSMGLVEVDEEETVWGIMCRDLCSEADRIYALYPFSEDCPYPNASGLPEEIQRIGAKARTDFIKPTCWPNVDIIPSCANAAFVEFASAQYRSMHKVWTFFGCISRYLDELADNSYDLIFFDCPPAIGYQSLNAVFAADILYIPSGPGYWEYDSTTSYLGQLGQALQDIQSGFGNSADKAMLTLPKDFLDIKVLMTRFDKNNPLHAAMREGYKKVFQNRLCNNFIALTRSVEQSGRFQNSIYEQDYRLMTRETWIAGRQSFDVAWDEMKHTIEQNWPHLKS